MSRGRTTLITAGIAVAAFVAGHQTGQMGEHAHAAAPGEMMSAQVINLADLKAAEISAPSATGSRSRQLAAADGMALGVQEGVTGKHYHAGSHELQYVVSGTGSEWLGDRIVQLKPGDLLIIPKGTPHGGLTDGVRLMSLKTPPQAQGDSHPLP